MSDTRYPDRKWVIFDTSETGSIDFSQVMELDENHLRLNISESRTFVKYEGSQPSSVTSLTSKSEEYTHSEILSIFTGSEWQPELP